MKNPEIEQSWWHIEDQLKPSKCRIFRQVMDLYVENNYFEIDLPASDGNISGLQIISRNKPMEIPFIVKDHKLYVNLGEIEQWPSEMDINSDNAENLKRHVKIEIKYMEEYPDPQMGIELNEDLNKSYTGYLSIKLPIRPEFRITIPHGLEIENDGKKLELTLFVYGGDYNSENCRNENDYDEISLKIEAPIINRINGKKTYTYLISPDSQNIILDVPNECEMLLQATYHVRNEPNFWGIPVFAGILIVFTVVEVLRVLTNVSDIGTPELSMLIALFSFTAFVLTLNKENYEIPCSRFVIASIIFTIMGMFIILMKYLIFLDFNTIINQIIQFM